MKTISFLVLLDDLWDQINLEDVGIPYPLGNVNNLKRKVVLTTRLRKVCGQMEVRKELKVTYLQEHEAWKLFEKNIGAETFCSPHIEDLARELMTELKGLPLALTSIGKAMYRKNTAQWETAIQYMQQSCCTDDKDPIELGMETNVFRQLKFTYDNLRNDTLRCCFLTCALWPEDEKILEVDLARCWMGLGLVNEEDMESSFRKSYSLIADLTAVCLLEGWGDWYGFVKVHDLIRDMALWISRDCGERNDKWIVPAPVSKDVIPWSRVAKTVECISLAKTAAEGLWLMSNRVTQLVPTGFNPMKLRILCLQNNKLDESVIAGAIKNCTSLTYLDLRGNTLKRIPEELCSLGKLEYLDLSENQIRVKEVPRCFGNLISLKFLYLKSSGIQTIPVEVIYRLKALQVIDLRSFSSGLVARGALFRELGTLPKLKALGTEAEGFAQFESLREAANLPVRYLSLRGLNNNKGAFCLSEILPNDFAQRTLYDLDVSSCVTLEEITVRHDTRQPNNHFGSLNKLRISSMPLLKEITWVGAAPASILPRLVYLDLSTCFGLLHVSWVMYLPRLEQLHITDCFSIVQPFMRCHGDKLCSGQANTKTFPCLKSLHLILNRSLDTIGDNGMEFPSLERLVLTGCPKLKRLPFQLDSLPLKLKELRFDDVQYWERLECEEGVKNFLQPALRFGREYE